MYPKAISPTNCGPPVTGFTPGGGGCNKPARAFPALARSRRRVGSGGMERMGATLGTRLLTWLRGELVGRDEYGNSYYRLKGDRAARRGDRRLRAMDAGIARSMPPGRREAGR